MLLEIKCQEHDIGSEDMRILASLLPIFRQNQFVEEEGQLYTLEPILTQEISSKDKLF